MDGAEIRHVVILGGGTAGWLSACMLSAGLSRRGIAASVTLVEASDIPTIGVGEGTWPTMRGTLAAIGIEEAEFLGHCEASFKQGSRFDGWVTGAPADSYLHPFTPPPPGDAAMLLAAWRRRGEVPFAAAMTAQHGVAARSLAPRQPGMPGYAGALNYAYHLDAGKFAKLLARHARERLGVVHVEGRVEAVEPRAGDPGQIAALILASGRRIEGDLFLDCSGLAARLIGEHCKVPLVDRGEVLFNDRALAVQVPVPPQSPIASATVATAHAAGWTWDIALPSRRGIGCVYASRFMDDGEAERILRDHVAAQVPGADLEALAPRLIRFPTGYRERFLVGNCMAVGLAAGFIEPLEASAIVMVELSLEALIANFPQTRAMLPIVAERIDALQRYRWERVIDFLKLHYVLSQRPEPYWQAHREEASVPERLGQLLALWRQQPPSVWDFPEANEIFSAASHQYVLYGMGFPSPEPPPPGEGAGAVAALDEIARRARALLSALPENRACLAAQTAGHVAPSQPTGELCPS